MAKRKPNRRRRSRPAFVTRLPFPPPFTRDQWGGLRMIEMVADPVTSGYLAKCFGEILDSGRHRIYLDVLVMIAHIGRLPEFDERSYGKFLDEAHAQHFTSIQLERALDLILQSSGPAERILPTAAAAYEFLAFVGDFVHHYAEHTGAGQRLRELSEQISAMALMAFAVAVNAELGISNDCWQK